MAMRRVDAINPDLARPAEPRRQSRTNWLQSRYMVPPEHGAWVWWLGPFIVGVAAARSFTWELGALFFAVLAGFLLRQPVSLLARAFKRGKPSGGAAPVLFWLGIYGAIAGGGFIGLLAAGHHWAGLFAAALALAGAAQLRYGMDRAGRHSLALQLLGAVTLALCAPAAYLAGGDADYAFAGGLWALLGVYGACTVVLVRYRIQTRRLPVDDTALRYGRSAAGAAALCGAGLLLAGALYGYGVTPLLAGAVFLIPLADIADSVLRPPRGHRPKQIGMRQLAASSAFYLLFLATL